MSTTIKLTDAIELVRGFFEINEITYDGKLIETYYDCVHTGYLDNVIHAMLKLEQHSWHFTNLAEFLYRDKVRHRCTLLLHHIKCIRSPDVHRLDIARYVHALFK